MKDEITSKDFELKEICNHCGACFPFCGWKKDREADIENVEKHGTCNICYLICPRTSLQINEIERRFFRDKRNNDDLGYLKACYSVKSLESVKGVQDSGFITSLLKFLLRERIIDSAIVTKRDKEWRPVPFVASTVEEIDSAVGSKYSVSPSLSMLKEAVNKYDKTAFVGLPCQIQALRNMQLQNEYKFGAEKISPVIGIFCHENFSYTGLKSFVEGKIGIPMHRVKKFDVYKVKFVVHYDSTSAKRKVSDLKDYVWTVCHGCRDYTAEFADISVGAVGSKEGGNTVVVRSEFGDELLKKMTDNNLISVEGFSKLSLLEKISRRKKKRIIPISEEVQEILFLK